MNLGHPLFPLTIRTYTMLSIQEQSYRGILCRLIDVGSLCRVGVVPRSTLACMCMSTSRAIVMGYHCNAIVENVCSAQPVLQHTKQSRALAKYHHEKQNSQKKTHESRAHPICAVACARIRHYTQRRLM